MSGVPSVDVGIVTDLCIGEVYRDGVFTSSAYYFRVRDDWRVAQQVLCRERRRNAPDLCVNIVHEMRQGGLGPLWKRQATVVRTPVLYREVW